MSPPKPRRAGGRLGRAAAGPILLAWLAGAACRLPQVTSANLDALHDDRGRHLYVAPMLTPTRYVLDRLSPFGIRPLEEGLHPAAKRRKLKDPSEACLMRQLRLAQPGNRGPAIDAARVRHAAWIASHDSSELCRERAYLLLGAEAARLELGRPARPADSTVPEAELATALSRVVEVLRPVMLLAGRASQSAHQALASACGQVLEMEVDLAGGRHALEIVERLSWTRTGEEPELEPFWEMSRSLQAKLLRRVLAAGTRDPSELVRAAAIEANWRAYGDLYLLRLLDDLGRMLAPDGRVAFERLDLVRLLELVRASGLPTAPELDAQSARRLVEDQLGTLLTLAVRVGDFDEHVRGAAMRALGAVSDAGFESLRFEDWTRWWEQRRGATPDAEEPPAAVRERP